MKNLLNGLSGLDKKLAKYIIGAAIFVVVGIITLIVLKFTLFGKIPVEKLEDKMEAAAMNYFADNEKSLPAGDKDVATVTISDLVNGGYLKSLDKLLKDETLSCSGEVTVTNNAGYYLYSPNVNCGEAYKTKKLYEEITNPKNIVTSKDGLYQVGKEYIYKGEKVKNYVEFDGQIWRIIKVNEDNSIKLMNTLATENEYVWDNRYNKKEESYSGINDYEVSRIKSTLNELWADNKIVTEQNKKYVVTQKICMGYRTKKDNDVTSKTDCSRISANNQSLSLPLPSDFMLASIDNGCTNYTDLQCTNYNYMATLKGTSWSSIVNNIDYETNEAFKIGNRISTDELSEGCSIRPVIILSDKVIYTDGDGSSSNPYKIKSTQTTQKIDE